MTPRDRLEWIVEPDAEALAERAAHLVSVILGEACAARGRASWVLAGGSSPQALYRRLASGSGEPVVWPRVSLFWGDERVISPQQPASNFGAAWSALSQLKFDPERVHRIEAERGAELAAAHYERTLREELGSDPRFDLVLLGVGDDGHTASLFPGDEATREERAWVRPAQAPASATPPRDRVTLTFPALRAARRTLFLVSGGSKAAIVRRILVGEADRELPAARVAREASHALWLLDRAAAADLEG